MRWSDMKRSKGVNLVDSNELCTLKDARAYIGGLMEEIPENSQAWETLNGAWCILNKAIEEQEK